MRLRIQKKVHEMDVAELLREELRRGGDQDAFVIVVKHSGFRWLLIGILIGLLIGICFERIASAIIFWLR